MYSLYLYVLVCICSCGPWQLALSSMKKDMDQVSASLKDTEDLGALLWGSLQRMMQRMITQTGPHSRFPSVCVEMCERSA